MLEATGKPSAGQADLDSLAARERELRLPIQEITVFVDLP
jgi:hypothetical protein